MTSRGLCLFSKLRALAALHSDRSLLQSITACTLVRPAAVSLHGFSRALSGPQACDTSDGSAAPYLHRQARHISVDIHGQEGEELSEKDYHRISDLTLGELMVKLEALIEETPGIADSDLEYQQGVLTLNLGSHGTYVINKQGPNKQIWMSSPVSGPVRYDLVDGRWIYKHDGHAFQDRLAEELKQITCKSEIDLDQEPQVEKGFMGYGADPT